MKKQLLTNSRMASFKECRRKHEYAYEIGLRRIDESRALRMGSAFHSGIESLGKGQSIDLACAAIRSYYTDCQDQFDSYDWEIECETILRLVCAYQWRWSNMPLEDIAPEFPFQLPLVNPETGKPTPIFDEAGKIDGIVRLEDGRLAIKETKTVSEDIHLDSDYWRRLRMDQQITLYISAARRMGYQVDAVLYDVARKPSIKPTAVPFRDADGIKVVLDAAGERVRNANGKTWRQTGDTEKGWVLQTRPMTVSEWGEKLTADIVERPEFYFARVEIARLDQDIEEFKHEMWAVQLAVREAQNTGRHFRTVNRHTCNWCEYFSLCSTNQPVEPHNLPPGFEIVTNKHPELTNECATETSTTTHESAAVA
jgi:hypothetical protein